MLFPAEAAFGPAAAFCLTQLVRGIVAKPLPVDAHQLKISASSSDNQPVQSPRRLSLLELRIASPPPQHSQEDDFLQNRHGSRRSGLHPGAVPYVPTPVSTQRALDQSHPPLNANAETFIPSSLVKAQQQQQQQSQHTASAFPHTTLAADEDVIHDARSYLSTQRAEYLHSIGVDPRTATHHPVYALPEEMYQSYRPSRPLASTSPRTKPQHLRKSKATDWDKERSEGVGTRTHQTSEGTGYYKLPQEYHTHSIRKRSRLNLWGRKVQEEWRKGNYGKLYVPPNGNNNIHNDGHSSALTSTSSGGAGSSSNAVPLSDSAGAAPPPQQRAHKTSARVLDENEQHPQHEEHDQMHNDGWSQVASFGHNRAGLSKGKGKEAVPVHGTPVTQAEMQLPRVRSSIAPRAHQTVKSYRYTGAFTPPRKNSSGSERKTTRPSKQKRDRWKKATFGTDYVPGPHHHLDSRRPSSTHSRRTGHVDRPRTWQASTYVPDGWSPATSPTAAHSRQHHFTDDSSEDGFSFTTARSRLSSGSSSSSGGGWESADEGPE